MALPEHPLPAELADYGISLLGDSEAPAWSSLRHYDSHMIDALRGRGFTVLLTQLLLVKELAARVPKPVREKGLVPSFGCAKRNANTTARSAPPTRPRR